MKNINTRLQEMTNKLLDKEIYNTDKLGNEINFHVFDYDPADEYVVRDYIYNYLATKDDLKIKVFDIYDLIINILKERGFLEKVFEFEKIKGTKYVNDLIFRTLGISSNNDQIVKRITENIQKDEIIILTGLGKCYGIVRGHTLLNNLQGAISENPVIMMYPGIYDGQSFRLFNKMQGDNYYRAFEFVGRE